ncbi:aluminum-activated malate transporter 8 [Carica papaya]|uniref:aluminum-activated malate transporter 8 n=1 Tax=Carica papaya TaxID=3649 RepID=UPI000B8D04A9|nr:aluminum-activated malate transporter 8 [Carica papaya]
MENIGHQQQAAGAFERAWSRVKAFPGGLNIRIMANAKAVKKLAQDDPRRVTHSLKVGLALTLVSLLYYTRPLYDGFGVSGMWAVLTVAVIFEFTVGGTLNKGLNRGLATFLAGALGVGAEHLASLFGKTGEPIVLGTLVFLLAAASTFSRFFPRIKQRYDYGVLIFILTFSLVAVSGCRVDEIIVLAHERLSTILIGGATCMVVCIFVCPVWAGEDLHKLIASNLDKVGSYLEGFGGEYFEIVILPEEKGSCSDVSKDDKSFLEGYKSVLGSKSLEETFANLARWEPGHGRFRLRHPWKQYLKIGALTRKCAYHIEALNGYLGSDTKGSTEFLGKVQGPCTTMSKESSKALKALSSAIKTMTNPSPANLHVENSRTAIKDLKIALSDALVETNDLLEVVPGATVASILIEIVKCVEKISESVHELSNLAHFKDIEATVSPEKSQQLLHRGSVNPVNLDGDDDEHVIITIQDHHDSPELVSKEIQKQKDHHDLPETVSKEIQKQKAGHHDHGGKQLEV